METAGSQNLRDPGRTTAAAEGSPTRVPPPRDLIKPHWPCIVILLFRQPARTAGN